MHRRSTDPLEQEISDWQQIRRALGPASPLALNFIDDRLIELRLALAVRYQAKAGGRRASDQSATRISEITGLTFPSSDLQARFAHAFDDALV